eukprot:TRINITY_DN43131_c0_g1_i1.p1 TRINITY_DN43131_c0_g1~~TRINITY_DN43131_c0_g1_i1.p1  ORF type:complete len:541 (-),score=61.54 TRINITY_DN43131_c0_g1_i1:56-1678(-)
MCDAPSPLGRYRRCAFVGVAARGLLFAVLLSVDAIEGSDPGAATKLAVDTLADMAGGGIGGSATLPHSRSALLRRERLVLVRPAQTPAVMLPASDGAAAATPTDMLTPSPVPALATASCSANIGCSRLGLEGRCCPTIDGSFLKCCTASHQKVVATCSASAGCAKLGLQGRCCPTIEGSFLPCCTEKTREKASSNTSTTSSSVSSSATDTATQQSGILGRTLPSTTRTSTSQTRTVSTTTVTHSTTTRTTTFYSIESEATTTGSNRAGIFSDDGSLATNAVSTKGPGKPSSATLVGAGHHIKSKEAAVKTDATYSETCVISGDLILMVLHPDNFASDARMTSVLQEVVSEFERVLVSHVDVLIVCRVGCTETGGHDMLDDLLGFIRSGGGSHSTSTTSPGLSHQDDISAIGIVEAYYTATVFGNRSHDGLMKNVIMNQSNAKLSAAIRATMKRHSHNNLGATELLRADVHSSKLPKLLMKKPGPSSCPPPTSPSAQTALPLGDISPADRALTDSESVTRSSACLSAAAALLVLVTFCPRW